MSVYFVCCIPYVETVVISVMHICILCIAYICCNFPFFAVLFMHCGISMHRGE